MSRDFILKIRVSQDERDTIQTKAKETEMTVSDFIRQRVLHFRVRQSGLSQNTSRNLARIGANINQIARWANTYKGGVEAVDIILRLDELQTEIKDLTVETCI